MEKRVSKIIAIALTIGLCGSVVQMNSMGIARRGYGWTASKVAAVKRRVSGAFRSASNAWSALDRNTGGIASMALNAATQRAFSFMINAALDKYTQGLLESSTEEKERIVEHIQKVAFFVPAIIIPEIWQVFRARGWRMRGALLSRSVYKLILSEAFYRAGVKLHKQGKIPGSLYSFFINQSSDFLSQATTDQLLLPATKKQTAPARLQETRPIIQKREIAPPPAAAQGAPAFVVKPVDSRPRITPAKRAVPVRPVAQQRPTAQPRMSRSVARRKQALDRLRRKQAAGRARRGR